MGRPLDKNNFGSGSGNIRVYADVGSGVGAGYIVEQTSTNEFIVDVGGSEGTIRLVGHDNPSVGEGYIQVFSPSGDFDGTGANLDADLGAESATVVAEGSGYDVSDTITIAGGTVDTVDGSASVFDVATVQPVDAQDETDFNGAGSNGTFSAGTGYATSEVITLSDGTTITVDAQSGGNVTQFTVDNSTTTSGSSSGATLTQSSSDGSGTGFDLTLGVNNQAVFSVTVNSAGEYDVVPSNPVSQGSTSGSGTGATLNVSWEVSDIDIVASGSNYDLAPTLSIEGGGGSGATATATVSGGSINTVTITDGGTGYTTVPTVNVDNFGLEYAIQISAHKVRTSAGNRYVWEYSDTPASGNAKLDFIP